MQKDKRCETCINNDRFGKTFCTVCENGDMYKEKGKLKYIDYNKYTRAVVDERCHPKTTLPITNVIFAPPATIVFWNDGTKSVVKCENEVFDPEKGLAMAIAKRALGNEGNYYETFKKWINDREIVKVPIKTKENRWRIWYREENITSSDTILVRERTYKRKGDATRAARKLFADTGSGVIFIWWISQDNPCSDKYPTVKVID